MAPLSPRRKTGMQTQAPVLANPLPSLGLNPLTLAKSPGVIIDATVAKAITPSKILDGSQVGKVFKVFTIVTALNLLEVPRLKHLFWIMFTICLKSFA